MIARSVPRVFGPDGETFGWWGIVFGLPFGLAIGPARARQALASGFAGVMLYGGARRLAVRGSEPARLRPAGRGRLKACVTARSGFPKG